MSKDVLDPFFSVVMEGLSKLSLSQTLIRLARGCESGESSAR
jgi:hypothetical protein